MNRSDAQDIVQEALTELVPDADVTALGPGEAFRDALELDSLDFMSFVEGLGERAGIRIDDEDTPALGTLNGCVDFLVARA